MDAAILRDYLELATEHLCQGEENIRTQRQIITGLAKGYADTTAARARRAELECMQKVHEADRDRLLKELEEHG